MTSTYFLVTTSDELMRHLFATCLGDSVQITITLQKFFISSLVRVMFRLNRPARRKLSRQKLLLSLDYLFIMNL